MKMFIAAMLLAMTCFGQDLPMYKSDRGPKSPTPSLIGIDYEPLEVAKANNIYAVQKKNDGQNSAVARVGDAPPVLANFTWRNQGSCVANTNPDGSITMFHPGAPGLLFNWCMLTSPLPPPPYTIISGYGGHVFGKAATLGHHLYDSTTNKFIVYSTGSSDSGAAAMAAWRFTNFTTLSPGFLIYNYNNAMVPGGLLAKYVRIRDNGTHRTVAVSEYGNVWLTISITLNTDHMIPNEFGYTLRGTGDNMASLMNIHDLVATIP